MFRACDAVVLNKIDLLPYVDFDVARVTSYAKALKPEVRVFPIAATHGDGLEPLCAWLGSLGGSR